MSFTENSELHPPGVHSDRTGVLLVNLGTPDSPEPRDVRRYLAEFLMDPLVVDLPWPMRALLVYGLILPVRPRKSAEAYRKVWMPEGSPLLHHSRELERKLQFELGDGHRVKLGMRYGNPSIASAVDALAREGVSRVIALPLYPQYSDAATASSLREIAAQSASKLPGVPVRTVRQFFDHPEFIENFAKIGRKWLEKNADGFVLFSFHGLPVRQIARLDPTGSHCFRADGCCDTASVAHGSCYRAQCFATARSIASRLGLTQDRYQVSFQSRLGRTKWIEPYTDQVLPKLAARGVRKVGVMCPAFVADCLETLEEIAIRERASFIAAGGESLELIPSLNAEDGWVRGLARMVREMAQEKSGARGAP